jgi:hypothetical protein
VGYEESQESHVRARRRRGEHPPTVLVASPHPRDTRSRPRRCVRSHLDAKSKEEGRGREGRRWKRERERREGGVSRACAVRGLGCIHGSRLDTPLLAKARHSARVLPGKVDPLVDFICSAVVSATGSTAEEAAAAERGCGSRGGCGSCGSRGGCGRRGGVGRGERSASPTSSVLSSSKPDRTADSRIRLVCHTARVVVKSRSA